LSTARVLSDAGVDVLDVSLVASVNTANTDQFRQATGLPVIAVGKLEDSVTAGQALSLSGIDLVAIGYQIICDPDNAGKILLKDDSMVHKYKE
jgi:2,4-dienoyl-CoA reductase-like NADH-dependent reductase (Old Yellow Enzyme family)